MVPELAKAILFLLTLTSTVTGHENIDLAKNIKWQDRYADKSKGLIEIGKDSLTLDSIHLDYNEFKRISPTDKLIENLNVKKVNFCSNILIN